MPDPIPAPVVDTPTPPAVEWVTAGARTVRDVSTPPASAVWYDIDATSAAVLAQLRLEVSDVDESRVRALVPAAAAHIDAYCDRVTPLSGPPPDAMVDAVLQQVTIELYRRKDVALVGATSTWTADAVSDRYGAGDPIAECLAQLLPYKQRWGMA
jgi:hypothetical protein